MDLRQLRYFAQIVESGSLSKASRCLFVAQPALSQQVAKLEDEVGKPLLQRSSRGVVPTENGLALYHHARFMLRQMDQALSIARKDVTDLQGMVSLGLPPTTQRAIGLSLMKRIRNRYPGILLNVVEGMSGHVAQMIRLGQLDIAILFTNDVSSKLCAEPLLEEELFVIFPEKSGYIPHNRKSVSISELAQIPLILPTSSHGLRRRVVAEFEQRNMKPNVSVEIDSLTLLMQCVSEGMGATIKPMSALHEADETLGKWRALSISDAPITRTNYLYSLSAELMTDAARAVLGETREVARELIEGRKWKGVQLIERREAA
ncbi:MULTISPECIES: LysR substrate-binding domain-containing protein [Hyphomicrobiales]|jgi:LysR family transcriptional regulator, regulatory protein for tcuABC|uniref:LysR substrate-binding domain-containing protein n=1 Tax=Hyphomicrobiales TaxID=356 RepID=UPI000622BFC7|nr:MULTISPECIES: LysR substrate-binding domain-containing protein [Hyphomicrobiales]KQT22756.1 LysR family transcriptional regulator [Bradyrhizobium sp. Leaf396]CEJ88009.1 Transcriptional regulator, LysR family [Hyphomicrobium sp. GJ21]